MRRVCANEGLDYDQLARDHIEEVGPVKRGGPLRTILGLDGKEPLPAKPKHAPKWAGSSAADAFSPDVDEIDPREFDSE